MQPPNAHFSSSPVIYEGEEEAPQSRLQPYASSKSSTKLFTAAGMAPDLLPMWKSIQEFFEELMKLPPSREVEHQIQLQPRIIPKQHLREVLYGSSPPHTLGFLVDRNGLQESGAFCEKNEKEEQASGLVFNWKMEAEKVDSAGIRDNLLQVQQRLIYFANLKREKREFHVEDILYLKLRLFPQILVSIRKNLPPSSRFYGPYMILERIGVVAYKLKLPESSRDHPIFHVLLLKRCMRQKIVPEKERPKNDFEGTFVIEPQFILEFSLVDQKGTVVPQILLQRTNSAPTDAKGEVFKFIWRKFPPLDPRGRGSSGAGGIVMDCGRVKKKEEEEKLEKWSRMPIWGRKWDQKGRKEDGFGPLIWAAEVSMF